MSPMILFWESELVLLKLEFQEWETQILSVDLWE